MRWSGQSDSPTGAAALTYGTNLAVAVLSLFNVMLVAGILGAAGRGDVALLMTIPMLSAHLGSLGVQEANANIGASRPEIRAVLATNSVLFGFGLGGLTALLVAASVEVAPAIGGEVAGPLLWLSLTAVPVLILKLYMQLLLQSDYRFGTTNLAWLLGPITTATVNGICAAAGVLSVSTAIVAWLGGQVLGLVLLGLSIRRHFGFGRPSSALARNSLGFGLKAHLGHFMSIGNYRVDQWLVGSMAGSRELGLYSVAVAWAEVLFYIPGVVVLIQRPDLVRARPRDAAAIASRVLRRAILLAGGVGVGLFAAAPLLCPILLGAEFADSALLLRVLAVGALGIVVLELLSSALIAQRRPLRASSAIGFAFVTTVALDLLLIPSLGGLGAAIATSAAYTVGGAVVIIVFTRALGSSSRDLLPRWADLVWYRCKLREHLARHAPDRPRTAG